MRTVSMPPILRAILWTTFAPLIGAGCGGSSPPDNANPDAASQGQTTDGSAGNADGTSGSTDDAGPPAPRNASCTPLTAQTGTAVNTSHGRLDGTLVYVLPVDGPHSCNGDSSHVHLQVEVAGSVYDVAVDIGSTGDEVGMYEGTMAMPNGAWAEGWHGADNLGYPALGIHQAMLTLDTPANIAAHVEALLTTTSTISIYCTGYTPTDNGCHDVHYQNGLSEDGALVLNPTAATSPVLFFKFSKDAF